MPMLSPFTVVEKVCSPWRKAIRKKYSSANRRTYCAEPENSNLRMFISECKVGDLKSGVGCEEKS